MSANTTNSNNNNNNHADNSDDDSPPLIPYRRDRTPSIVVQSLGISFHKDSNITESIELPNDEGDSSQKEATDPKSSTSGVDNPQNVGVSAKGSLSSPVMNSPVHGTTSTTRACLKEMFAKIITDIDKQVLTVSESQSELDSQLDRLISTLESIKIDEQLTDRISANAKRISSLKSRLTLIHTILSNSSARCSRTLAACGAAVSSL